jgi:hypothetical protein
MRSIRINPRQVTTVCLGLLDPCLMARESLWCYVGTFHAGSQSMGATLGGDLKESYMLVSSWSEGTIQPVVRLPRHVVAVLG